MRIMLDTNVLISLLFFPSKKFRRMMEIISTEYTLVLSSYVIDELLVVTDRKFPDRSDAVDRFLTKLSYEMVYTPRKMKKGLFEVRDMKDYPVLYTAIMEEIDVLVSGDKDLTSVDIEKPEILTPAEFLMQYDYNNDTE